MNISYIANKYEEWKQGLKKHSYLQLTDNNELVIDNCKTIVKYDENLIELKLAGSGLNIIGRGLKMSNFGSGGVIIRGVFDSLKFI
ncbi:MAG: YabP/YqfC family sporulation protein [Eubacterium sp.]|jgi:hypothetical protein|nr:YabP/YqfC family sporulation protein [Eubacterium sp.]